MRVLSYAWYIFDSRLKPFSENYSGGGLVVKNLCNYIGKQHESYLFLGQIIEPEMMIDNIKIVKTDYDVTQKNVKNNNKEYINYMTNIFKQAVEKIKPDIINFHGYGDLAESIIKNVCAKISIPCVLTCHLYEGINVEYSGYKDSQEISKKILQIPNMKIITVSNGMKRRILEDYKDYDEKKLVPILNGTDFNGCNYNSDLKKKFKIQNKKILLCAGTIGSRKNQIQLVRIFKKYANLREKIYVIFCGKKAIKSNYDIKEDIKESGLTDCMSYVGAVQNEKMKDYYSIADALIIPSYAEGLSISALEALTCGLSLIMYADSECADDLNDPKVCCFADSHSDVSMMKAIEKWYSKQWDNEYIKAYSKRFTMEEMTKNYLNFYEQLVLKN